MNEMEFSHSGVWCCDRGHDCKWQCFAGHAEACPIHEARKGEVDDEHFKVWIEDDRSEMCADSVRALDAESAAEEWVDRNHADLD